MIAFLKTLLGAGAYLPNRSSTFYIENSALLAILKNSANPIAIQATTGLLWRRIRELNITPMIGRVPSKRNIADLPTLRIHVKYKSVKSDKCRMTFDLNKPIERDIVLTTKGLPLEPHSGKIRILAPPIRKTKQERCGQILITGILLRR